MSVLGILTCEILELEFAHILGADSEVARVVVVENAQSARLIAALEAQGRPLVQRIPHLHSFQPTPAEPLTVIVRVLEFALHRKREILQRALIQAARELRPYMDALLLGYGLCGNALENPRELLDVGVPVFIPMDEDHPVDDCVGLLIGGRACYFAEQCQTPGTFFMIPGWTHHWPRIFGEDFCGNDPATARRLFAHYERALLVPTPVMSEAAMRRNTAEFIRLFGVRVEVRAGTLVFLQQAWERAKASVKGSLCTESGRE
ncbi:MAG TPA: DUF1638 domain-containing protein [Anaerolineae bacterium]|nr:DUF1638 domain-containing protein [Anaerolineae bacterium]